MEDRAPKSLTAKTVNGLGWVVSSTFVMAVGRAAMIGVMARLLTPADFGTMAAAGIFIELARLFAASGILQALVQRPEITREEIETAFTANLISAVLCSVIICLFAGSIASYLGNPDLRHILYACSTTFPLIAIAATSSKILERRHEFAVIAATEMKTFLISSVIVAIPMALLGFGVWSLVASQVAAFALRSGMLFRAQPHSLRLKINGKVYRDLMRTGFGYGSQRFANLISMKGDYFVVGSRLGQIPLGEYERAYVLMNLSNSLVTSALSTVLFPAFSRVNHDNARLRMAFASSSTLVALVFLPISAMSILLAPEIVGVLLGSQWGNIVVPFQILAAGMFFRNGYKIAQIVIDSLAKVYWGTAFQVTYALLVVGGAYLLSPLGITGVAVSTLLAISITYMMLVTAVLIFTKMRIMELLGTIMPGISLALLTGGLSWAVASPLRAAHVSPLIILVVAASVALAIAIGLVLIYPAVLGRHGRAMSGLMIAAVRARLVGLKKPV